ncbi:MAG: hypothetical protein BZY75_00400 [SAR202 cluster bacterium Io17-Chloro-G7]|nr:MAG: hypothetical protein BZY75_00400 [SAR202 cluster bacterium Io17-Chloro-G7]
MVVFRPFRGWRYDSVVVGDPASVLSPPYDMISIDMQESLRRLSPYNVVHLEAGESLDWSAPTTGQYTQTASLFEDWIAKGALKRDAEPSFYLLRQQFQHGGGDWSRLGIIGCVGLEQYEDRKVLPHENTEAPAIRDRVSLMEACGANFSPIMSAYRDAEGSLSSVFQRAMAETPVVDVPDGMGGRSTLWRMADPEMLSSITQFFHEKPVFLADGHHRYDAALQYQRKKNQETTSQGAIDYSSARDRGAQAHDFVLMTMIGFEDPGLLVLPYHRVLGGLSEGQLAQFQDALFEIFEANPFSSEGDQSADSLVAQVAEKGTEGHSLGVVGPALLGPKFHGPQLLTLRDGVDWRKWGSLAVSEAWILEERVLKPVLGEATLDHLGYSHDHQEAVEQVADGTNQGAFLLKPFPMTEFQEIVGQGQKLPRKSTFFYPKLPTGMVINQLGGVL